MPLRQSTCMASIALLQADVQGAVQRCAAALEYAHHAKRFVAWRAAISDAPCATDGIAQVIARRRPRRPPPRRTDPKEGSAPGECQRLVPTMAVVGEGEMAWSVPMTRKP